MLCAACLAAARRAEVPRRGGLWRGAVRTAQFVLALATLWFTFALVGQLLLTAPSDFHRHVIVEEGTTVARP